MLKLKLQYFGHLMRRTDSLEKTGVGEEGTPQAGVYWAEWPAGSELPAPVTLAS